MTRDEVLAMAEEFGPDGETTDYLEHVKDSKGIIFISDIAYRWDEVCQDFECIG